MNYSEAYNLHLSSWFCWRTPQMIMFFSQGMAWTWLNQPVGVLLDQLHLTNFLYPQWQKVFGWGGCSQGLCGRMVEWSRNGASLIGHSQHSSDWYATYSCGRKVLVGDIFIMVHVDMGKHFQARGTLLCVIWIDRSRSLCQAMLGSQRPNAMTWFRAPVLSHSI